MDVAGWLRQLGLEQYEAAFRENDVNLAVLPSLTAEDLKGPRRHLRRPSPPAPGGHRRIACDGPINRDQPTEALPINERRIDAERRQLSVMFCESSASPRCRLASTPRT